MDERFRDIKNQLAYLKRLNLVKGALKASMKKGSVTNPTPGDVVEWHLYDKLAQTINPPIDIADKDTTN